MRAFFRSRYLSGGVLFFFLFFLSSDVVPQGDPGNMSFAELLAQGKKYYDEKDYENAIIRLLQAHRFARSDAEKVDVYFALSQAYFDFDEKDFARNYLRKIWNWLRRKQSTEKDVSKGYWKLFQDVKKAIREASPQVVASRFRARDQEEKAKQQNPIDRGHRPAGRKPSSC